MPSTKDHASKRGLIFCLENRKSDMFAVKMTAQPPLVITTSAPNALACPRPATLYLNRCGDAPNYACRTGTRVGPSFPDEAARVHQSACRLSSRILRRLRREHSNAS